MSKWISTGDLEASMGHKILIAGLQEAGKTAIKRVFFLRQQAVEVEGLKATIDYERLAVRLNNVAITVVDLGGQRIFIRRFLNSFSPFIFNSVHIMVFVIDVSLKSTRNNAIQYFASAIEKLKEYSPTADVYVLLHKNDLVKKLPNYESVHAQMKEQFQIESEKQIKFFRTTIFDDSSIINAFGRIFELSIPKAAKSKFVDGRTIEKGEEFSSKFAVSQFDKEKEERCPFCNISLFQSPDGYECNICGFKPRKRPVISDDEPVKPKVSVADLQAKLSAVKVKDNSKTIVEVDHPSTESIQGRKIIKTKIFIEDQEESIFDSIFELSLNKEKSREILTQKHKKFLLFCLNFGVSLDLIRFLINEYIPKYNPVKLNLFNPNLLKILSTFKDGFIKDKDVSKFIFYNEYFDNLTLEDLLWHNFPSPFKEQGILDSNVDLEKQKLGEDLIELSFKENIGAKLFPKEFNVEIIFYQGKKKLGQITIPFDITEKDLKYMLIFEVKFPIEKNLQGFVEQSVILLFKEVKNYKSDTVQTTADTDLREFILIQESEEIRLADNVDIFCKIKINNPDFVIDFTNKQREFGQIFGSTSISAPGMFQLIKNNTLIPSIIDEDELMFVVLSLYNKFSERLKYRKI